MSSEAAPNTSTQNYEVASDTKYSESKKETRENMRGGSGRGEVEHIGKGRRQIEHAAVFQIILEKAVDRRTRARKREEVFYVLQGSAEVTDNGVKSILNIGDSIYGAARQTFHSLTRRRMRGPRRIMCCEKKPRC